MKLCRALLSICLLLVSSGLILAGCGMASTSPEERSEIKGLISRMAVAQANYYRQYRRTPRNFSDFVTAGQASSPIMISLAQFGPYASNSPCQVRPTVILCPNTFEFYKNVQYNWQNGRITVSAIPGKYVPALETVDQ